MSVNKESLMTAAADNQIERMEYLLQNGYKIEDKDARGYTALSIAVKCGSFQAVQFLVQKGAKLDALNIQNSFDREKIQRMSLPEMAAESGHAKILDYLLKNKAELEGQDGLTGKELLLQHAMCFERMEIIDYLLRNEIIKVHERNALGQTPLDRAAKIGYLAATKFLLNFEKININEQDKEGRTALYFAIEENNYDIVVELVKKGAFLDIVLNNGKTLYDDLKEKSENIKLTNLGSAEAFKAIKTLEILASLEFALKLFDVPSGRLKVTIEELLKLIPRASRFKIENVLLDGRQVKTGNTVLHLAIINKQKEMVWLLLDNGANVLMKNNDGESALLLLQRVYSNDVNLFLKANQCAVVQLEKNMAQKKSMCFPILEFKPELKKEIKEREFENKETKETKETKEAQETKSSVDIKQDLIQYQHHLHEIESCLPRIPAVDRIKICYEFGKKLLNQKAHFFSPPLAYCFLEYILWEKSADVNQADVSIEEIHRIMQEILIKYSIQFEENGDDEKLRPVYSNLGLEQDTQESEQSSDHRRLRIIEHGLRCNGKHNEVLGRYMAEFIGLNGFQDLEDIRDNSVVSQVKLILAFKEHVQKTNEQESKLRQELKVSHEKMKAMQEEIEKLRMLSSNSSTQQSGMHFQFQNNQPDTVNKNSELHGAALK